MTGSDAEQQWEQRLSVFAGPFSRQAAEAVCVQDERENTAGVLDRLTSQGRLTTQGQGDDRRYALSDEQRKAGRKQLSANGTEQQVYSRLVEYYLGFAEQSLEGAFGPDRAVWIDRLEQEHANLQAVFSWLIGQGEAERGLRLAYLLQELWFEDRHTGEGRTLFATLLALPAASARTRSRAQYLDLAGAFALNQADYAEARSLKKEGIAICRELEDQHALGSSLIHLGHVELHAGDFPAAQTLYQEALDIFLSLGDEMWISFAIGNLGSVALELGDLERADGLVRKSVRRYRDQGFEWELALAIGNAAGVAASLGQPERSIRLAGASAAQRERIGISMPPVFEARFERIIAPARQALSGSAQRRAWEEGQEMTLEQATEYALDGSLEDKGNE